MTDQITRRGFLGGIAAATIVAASPAAAAEMLYGWFPVRFVGDSLPLGIEAGITYWYEGGISNDHSWVSK